MTHEHDTTVQDAHAEAHDEHSDVTVIFGRTIPLPVYTVVFFVLGVLTVLELLLAELPRDGFSIAVMMGLALIKAFLVVYFYMHLRTDNRLFAATLLFPVIMVVIAIWYLLQVPVGY